MRPAGISVAALVLALAFVATACSTGEERADSDSPLGSPPGRYVLSGDEGVARIPFEVYCDEIMMDGLVNGRKARLMIDNGVMWDEILLFGSSRVDSMGLVYVDRVDVGGAGEGEAVQSGLASGVNVSFPGVDFADQIAIVTPESQGFADMWEADGQVCGTFFKHFVVDMDFDERLITLIPPDEFVPSGEALELSLAPVGAGSWAFPGTVTMSDGTRVPVSLTMDIGGVAALSVLVFDGSPLPVPEDAVEASLGYGIQGEIRGHRATLDALRIGDYVLEGVPAGFSESGGHSSAEDAVIVGFPVLSRFNITFDYPGGRVFVTPNARFGEPFAHEDPPISE